MTKKPFAIITLLVFAFTLSGCATVPEEHRGAATGAAVGATTGAVAGALLGHHGAKTETAIIGGLVGAFVGGAIGHYAYDVKRSEQETAQRYNYTSAERMVRIEDVSVSPAYIRPGDRVDMKAVYAVLGGAQNSETSVTETREIRYQGELLGKPEVNVMRRGGTYESTVPLFLPNNARRGSYKLMTIVQAGTSRDSREISFFVE